MTKNKTVTYITSGLLLVLLVGAPFFIYTYTTSSPISSEELQPVPTPMPQSEENGTPPTFTPPLNRAVQRVTKKPYGIHISPTRSPVNPEKFTGIHTGTDFETFPEEVDTDVPVTAICSGPLLRKQQARGYGGMVVQACSLNNNPITVVYGHLQLASINWVVGDQLAQGTTLGILGKGYSPETDGERKHLHLGVHTGAQVVTNGYIANQADLDNWLDVMQYIQ